MYTANPRITKNLPNHVHAKSYRAPFSIEKVRTNSPSRNGGAGSCGTSLIVSASSSMRAAPTMPGTSSMGPMPRGWMPRANPIPSSGETCCAMPSTALTRARCSSGTWSGSSAWSADSTMLSVSCASSQPIATTSRFGANPTMPSATMPPSAPPMIHGRLRPSLDLVRSLRAPVSRLATIAIRAPSAAMRPRLASLPTGSSCSILIARVVTTGVIRAMYDPT